MGKAMLESSIEMSMNQHVANQMIVNALSQFD